MKSCSLQGGDDGLGGDRFGIDSSDFVGDGDDGA